MRFEEQAPFDPALAGTDPARAVRAQQAVALPKRFYTTVSVAPGQGGFELWLDGKPALTPGRNRLALATHRAAELVAKDWRRQGDTIDPARMWTTKIANTGIDHVSQRADEVRADAAKYAGSDLLCYRAEGPDALAGRQRRVWNPVLRWAETTLGARLVMTEGVGFVEQPSAALAAVRARFDAVSDPVALAALHVTTTLAGSALLALAVWDCRLAATEAFDAAELDADYTLEVWGEDEEALARRALRLEEFCAAAALALALCG